MQTMVDFSETGGEDDIPLVNSNVTAFTVYFFVFVWFVWFVWWYVVLCVTHEKAQYINLNAIYTYYIFFYYILFFIFCICTILYVLHELTRFYIFLTVMRLFFAFRIVCMDTRVFLMMLEYFTQSNISIAQ